MQRRKIDPLTRLAGIPTCMNYDSQGLNQFKRKTKFTQDLQRARVASMLWWINGNAHVQNRSN